MINKQLINLSSPASSGGNAGEEGLILHLDANDVDSYDGDGTEWVDIKDHEYTPATNVSEHFNTVIWDGNSAATRDITGVGFKPDLVWIKNRNDSFFWHNLWDSVRGVGYGIFPNVTNAQDFQSTRGYLSEFQDDGFELTRGSVDSGNNNETGKEVVAWCFKAGGAAVSNTDGTVTSQVSANNDLGFSIVKYTGNLNNTTSATGAPIGHGLGTPPELIIFKNLSTTTSWHVYSKDLANWSTRLYLNDTSAADNVYSSYPIANPTGSVFYTNYLTAQNVNNNNYIAYCFASKRGVSKVGSYTGTGAAGNKVYTGFEPAFVMFKNTSTTGNWIIHDNKRDTDNPRVPHLRANTNSAEDTGANEQVDFNRDGFTLKGTGQNANSLGHKFIYYAVAKNTNETSLIPDTDLELHLDADSFDGSTETPSTWTDSSANSNNGTISGATFDAELGNWLNFDGADDYISFPQFDISSDGVFTLEMWVNPASTQNQYANLFDYGHDSSNGFTLQQSNTSTNNYYFYALGVAITFYIPPNQWTQVVVTVDANNLAKFYLDGLLIGTSSNIPVNTTGRTLNIGRWAGGTARYWRGKIGQVRTYSSALTQDQIRQNYNFTKPSYPNGNDGTINGATWNAGGYFDFVNSNRIDITTVSPVSLSIWVKPDLTSGIDALAGHNSITSNYIYWNSGDLTVNGAIFTDLDKVTDWTHIAIVESGSNLLCYKNGVLLQTITGSLGDYNLIGARTAGTAQYLNGQISKVKVYDKPLTQEEITALYNEGQ